MGCETGALQRDASVEAIPSKVRFAFADERQRHMRERREVAACSDRAAGWDDRRNAAIEHRDDKVERLGFHARMTRGQ